ncbi:hypothetical protein K7X08_019829 [Anisodus acutangulus]|uniref:Uncharacterized protein n=1 Tax=Anisodus acutangulus TaxID=402998 RepID=A0A9Q1MVP4_9SOLA|nr:hypothetical protein K7X08_019829 [Anisodus acutangulus]
MKERKRYKRKEAEEEERKKERGGDGDGPWKIYMRFLVFSFWNYRSVPLLRVSCQILTEFTPAIEYQNLGFVLLLYKAIIITIVESNLIQISRDEDNNGRQHCSFISPFSSFMIFLTYIFHEKD